jgi:hypothetical protein
VGSDAEVFVFDHARYVDEVVPAVVDVLRTGSIEAPWLAWFTAYRPEGMDLLRQHRVDLDEHCLFLGTDLRYLDGSGTSPLCRWADCPVRDRCPLHETAAQLVGEAVSALFEVAVCLRCLGPGKFVGRSYTPRHHLRVLERLGVPDQRVRDLLEALALRATALRRVGWSEGIHGWLTAGETAELALHLDELPLPRYEASFERMRIVHEEFSYGPDHAAGHRRWEELSLSFLRTAAFVAADQDRGILWANDVCVELTQRDALRCEQVRLRRLQDSRPG